MLAARHVEPVWSAREFVKFVVVVVGATGLCTCVVIYSLVLLLSDQLHWRNYLLYEGEFYGSSPLMAAFAVVA